MWCCPWESTERRYESFTVGKQRADTCHYLWYQGEGYEGFIVGGQADGAVSLGPPLVGSLCEEEH